MLQLSLVPLTKTAFEPYGDVIECEGSDSFDINEGTTTRFHDLANVEFLGSNAKPVISIFRCQQFHLPIVVDMMERHPQGSQAFVPLNEQSFMSVVAEDDNGVPVNPKAFLVHPNQGVNYRANTWHFTLTTFDKTSNFLIIDRAGDGNNQEKYFFEKPYVVRS